MKRPLLFLNIFLFFFCLQAQSQTDQSVTAGNLTATVSFPTGGCVYNWVNDNPAIGLPASGTGDISSFTAVNNGNTVVKGNITATPVRAGFAYITNSNDGTISVINTILGSVIKVIPIGSEPYGVATSKDGKFVYITNGYPTSVSVISTTTNTVISTIPVNSYPQGIAVSADDKWIYVANSPPGTLGTVSVINTATNGLVATITVGTDPGAIVISPDGSTVYVANAYDGSVSVINTTTNKVVSTLQIGQALSGEAISPDGSRLYLVNDYRNNVSVINTTTGGLLATIPVGSQPSEISISPDGTKAYVTNFRDFTVSVINTATNKVVSVISVGNYPAGISVSPDGTQVFAVNNSTNNISVINASTNKVVSSIAVGSRPVSFGSFISSGPGCNNAELEFTITVNPAGAALPTINTGPVSGTINACFGTASSSPNIQQFTVSGSNLPGDILASAPSVFEVSLSPNSGYGNFVTLKQTGGVVNSTKVYVRSAATASAGIKSGYIDLTSGGFAGPPVPVTETINALPALNTIASQTRNNGESTASVNFTGTGNTFNWVNDTPGIGLAASGTGDIASFKAVNTGSSPVKATITATPSSAGFAYVPDYGSNDVSVINTTTNTVIKKIPVGKAPWGVSVSPNGNFVYVTNQTSNSVSVIDASTNSLLTSIPVGVSPEGIVVSADGSRVYVANMQDGAVSVIDAATNKVISKITVGSNPQGIAVSPDGKYVYVTSAGLNNISVINTATNIIAATIGVGTAPIAVAVSPDNSKVYVANLNSGNVSVIDATANKLLTTITVGAEPDAITVSPDGKFVYVTNGNSSSVSVINTLTNAVISVIPTSSTPGGVSMSQDGTLLYIGNFGSATVTVFNISSNSVIATVPVGQFPSLRGNVFKNGTGCIGSPAKFTITVNADPAAVPTIAQPTTTGNNVACLGVASVSPYIQQFKVSGINLTGGITATVVGAQFEISLNPNSGYAASLTIPQTGGAVNGVVVYARAAATTSAGNLTGGVKLTSPGALTVNAGLSGLVNGLPYMGGVSPQVFTGGQLTSAINFITNGNNVNWTNSNPGIGLPATGTGNILPFMAVNAGNTPITATIIATPVSVAGGCTGTSISFVITVNPAAGALPTIAQTTATGNNIACLGATSMSPNIQQFTVNATSLTGGVTAAVSSAGFEISLNASSGYTNSLTIPETGGAINNVIVYVRLVASTTAGNFTGGVMLTSPGATSVNVGSITGVVNVPPVMDGNVPSPTYINGQQTAAINFSANGNVVNWVNDTPGIGLPASGTGDISSFTAVNTGTAAVVAHIIATPTNPITGCTGTPVPFTITVNPTVPPNIVVIGPLSPLNTIYGTASSSTVFNVLGSGLTSGILVTAPAGFEVSSNDVTFTGSVIISSAGTQVYIRLAATTHVGNNYAGPIVLKSAGASDASIDMPVSSVTPAPLTITADNKRKTFGTANPVLTATYTGFVNGDTPADLTSPTVLSTIADVSSPIGQYPITLSGYASNDYTITPVPGVLTVIGAIVIPNTFTPNGDGINDTWNIKYLDTYNTCTVQIFNRYGESVYTSIGYGTPWDGTFKGAKLPTGTYYYVINLKNDSKLLSGFIAIVR